MAVSYLLQTLFIAFSFAQTLSYAPQDVSQYCIDNALVPDYPETVKPLMDSWSYQYLLGANGVWQSVNLDQYSESWSSSEDGESCSNTVFVEEPNNVPQDNWLITQHIAKSITEQSILYPTVVYINVTFKIESNCDICQNHFQLLLYNTNTSLSDIANRTTDFIFLANLTNSDDSSSLSTMFTKTFVIEANEEGFYLGLRDYGTNVTVSRFLVYRLVGPAQQVGLTLFPETPAPTVDVISVSGVCVANGNTTNGKLPVLNLNTNGLWINSDDQCYCIEGHQLVMLEGLHQCQACAPGTYKSLKDNSECLSCPTNSGSSVHGASICPCYGQFYRAPFETADDMCTVPPGAPSNLLTSDLTNTTVNLKWNAPTFLGGRTDTFYNIYSSNGTVTEKKNTDKVNTTSYYMTDLTPNTFHQITVTAENGVSELAGNSYLRSAITFLKTSVGVPLQVTGIYVRTVDDIVEWLPTSSIHGDIISYEIQLFSSEEDGEINEVDGTITLYEVNVTSDFPMAGQPVNVRVRAFTDAGPGQWSEPELFAEMNPFVPASSVSSTTMTNTVTPSSTSNSQTAPTDTSTTTSTTSTSTTSTTKHSTSNSATPTQSSDSPDPVIAIVAVVAGAVLILVIVSIGGFLYFIFRTIRLKHQKKREEIDYAPLVHYTAGDSGEETVKLEIKD